MSFPFDPAFRVLVDLLKAAIEHNEPEGRGQLARVVRMLPLTCRECRDLARGDPSVGFVMAYCAYLYQSGSRERYCDGLPESVNPGRIAYAITNARRRELIHMSDLLEARSLKAQEIDKSTAQLASPEIPTIPTNLPHKVKLFAWYLGQWHAEFECNPKYTNHYKPCQRKGCVRPAMVPINESFSAWDVTQKAMLMGRRSSRPLMLPVWHICQYVASENEAFCVTSHAENDSLIGTIAGRTQPLRWHGL